MGAETTVLKTTNAATKRILVVDDSPHVCEFFQLALGRRGHSVIPVTNGHNAVDHVKRDEYDLIFIDLHTPHFDGVDTLRSIKAVNNEPDIVLITGYPGSDLAAEALALGQFAMLHKPIRVPDLVRIVEGQSI